MFDFLAMGVNLPAHLVIIKSTQQYISGVMHEYSEGQILQMMGRAGRPQFDVSATVVIMTKDVTKVRITLSIFHIIIIILQYSIFLHLCI